LQNINITYELFYGNKVRQKVSIANIQTDIRFGTLFGIAKEYQPEQLSRKAKSLDSQNWTGIRYDTAFGF